MKKTAILVVLAVLLLSSGQALALDRECERILKLGADWGYSYEEVVRITSNGNPQAPVSHSQMEGRLRQVIAKKNSAIGQSPAKKKTRQSVEQAAVKSGPLYIIAGSNKEFRFSNEIIQVPPDIEEGR